MRYIRLDGEEYFLQDIFAIPVEHSVYNHVVYDGSTVERQFIVELDNDPNVRMFFKIPDRFKIKTRIITYNPDWAVYMEKDGEQRLYFVIETKGTLRIGDLRTPGQQKIRCGEAHFAALTNEVELKVARDWREFKIRLTDNALTDY